MKRVGILGAGQLARMLFQSSLSLNTPITLFSEMQTETLSCLSQAFIAPFNDFKMLDAFLKQVDVITIETENIPLETLIYLNQRKPVYPPIDAIKCTQDRSLEKKLFQQLAIPTNLNKTIEKESDLLTFSDKVNAPFFLKSRQFGYDGLGQYRIRHKRELEHFMPHFQENHFIAEVLVPFDREISLIAVRNTVGETQCYDLAENQHKNGILIQTQNRVADPLFALAKEYVMRVLRHFDYVGVLAMEFFVCGEQLLANEMAPRVHNSGHWTIEGAVTSQFENHLRAISDLPLGSTQSIAECIMHNILGSWPNKNTLLQNPELHVHDYAKSERPGRKLGHTTSCRPFNVLN